MKADHGSKPASHAWLALRHKGRVFTFVVLATILVTAMTVLPSLEIKINAYQPEFAKVYTFPQLGSNNRTCHLNAAPDFGYRPQCHDVLTTMVDGHWEERPHSKREMDDVQVFLNRTRKYHSIPASLERPDKVCGNVDFGPLKKQRYGLMWYRAMCSPFGATPCCYENVCMSRSVSACQCEQCYDMRQEIHAELATWMPSNPDCQMVQFEGERDTCKLLHNMTIYVMGDSFLRQFFISFLDLLRSEKPLGVLLNKTTPSRISHCDHYYKYFSECSNDIIRVSWECNNTVQLKNFALWKTGQASTILKTVGELTGVQNSVIVFGLGIHDNFNFESIKLKIFNPLFKLLSKSPWPKLVFVSPHLPGLLKSPLVTRQQTKSVLQYNVKIKELMKQMKIPVMDTIQLTRGVMSYDGTHYGKGVNDVKVQVFLNYILEHRTCL